MCFRESTSSVTPASRLSPPCSKIPKKCVATAWEEQLRDMATICMSEAVKTIRTVMFATTAVPSEHCYRTD